MSSLKSVVIFSTGSLHWNFAKNIYIQYTSSTLDKKLNNLIYTLSQKKFPPLNSVTLSNLNRFSKFLYCWKAYEICYKTDTTLPHHLRHVATLPWEIINSNFCRYSADMEENANKLHFICTDFNFSMPITVFWGYLCVFIKNLSSWLNTMLIVDKHCSDVCCDEFPLPQIDRKSKQVNKQWHGKFYLQSVRGKTRYVKHRKY